MKVNEYVVNDVVNELNFNEVSSGMKVAERRENDRNNFVLPIVQTPQDLVSNMG